jgi:hypothetical protein
MLSILPPGGVLALSFRKFEDGKGKGEGKGGLSSGFFVLVI